MQLKISSKRQIQSDYKMRIYAHLPHQGLERENFIYLGSSSPHRGAFPTGKFIQKLRNLFWKIRTTICHFNTCCKAKRIVIGARQGAYFVIEGLLQKLLIVNAKDILSSYQRISIGKVAYSDDHLSRCLTTVRSRTGIMKLAPILVPRTGLEHYIKCYIKMCIRI